jgi:hypothetical protein
MDMLIALVIYFYKEILQILGQLKDFSVRNMKITILVIVLVFYFRKRILNIIKMILSKSEKALYKVKDMLIKNKLLAILIISGIVLYFYKQKKRESFKYVLPDLKKELNAKDFGYVCCSSSYSKKPEKIQICMSDVMGPSCYYKLSRETEKGMEVITSGLFHKYIMHQPGSLIRFSDGELYKLLSRDPLIEPKDCKIVNLGSEEYDEADSSIPVTY